MKKVLFGVLVAATLFAGGYAGATDFPTYNWTGFYVGGNGGYEWTGGRTFPLTGTQSVAPPGGIGLLSYQGLGAYPLTSNFGQQGAMGGLQAGYNWQFNLLVTGIEADFDLSSAKGSSTTFLSVLVPGTGTFFSTMNISRRIDDLGTLRARIGFASGRTLFFGTGGLAYGQSTLGYSAALSNSVAGSDGAASNSTISWRAGWTLGVGVEYAMWEHWSAKAEYLYYDLGTQSTTIAATGVPAGESWTGTATVRNNGQVLRAGLNYKF